MQAAIHACDGVTADPNATAIDAHGDLAVSTHLHALTGDVLGTEVT